MNDKKLWPVFSEFIRLRDSNENGYCKCITCPNIRYFRQMDCGHGVSRQHMAIKYDETNNHAQCKICNYHKKGNPKEYKIAVDKKYGKGTWDDLEIKSRTVQKLGSFEFNVMLQYYKGEVEKLRSIKNLR